MNIEIRFLSFRAAYGACRGIPLLKYNYKMIVRISGNEGILRLLAIAEFLLGRSPSA